MKPYISVILPVYNAEAYLSDSIDSVLSQTFGDFEFLLINDGSTDRSKEIISSKRDSRIVYFENKNNCGVVRSLNKGLHYAKGRYIARMDADDISFPNRFEEQIKYFRKIKNTAALGTMITFDRKENEFNNMSPGIPDLYKVYLLKTNVLYHPTVMLDRYMLSQANLYYDKKAQYVEDYKLWTDLSVNNLGIDCVGQVLHYYRIHDNQISKLKYEVQQRKSLEVKLSYANYYFGDIISQKMNLYIGLVTGTKVADFERSDYSKLVDELIDHNNKHLYFNQVIFENFVNDLASDIV